MSIPGLPQNTTYAVHLRCPSVSGGKDWVGAVTSNGEIHTYWGKTGLVNQHASKAGNIINLQKIIDEKKNKGYALVDDYDPKTGGWSSQQQKATPPPQAPAQQKQTPKPPPNLKPLVDNLAQANAIQWDF